MPLPINYRTFAQQTDQRITLRSTTIGRWECNISIMTLNQNKIVMIQAEWWHVTPQNNLLEHNQISYSHVLLDCKHNDVSNSSAYVDRVNTNCNSELQIKLIRFRRKPIPVDSPNCNMVSHACSISHSYSFPFYFFSDFSTRAEAYRIYIYYIHV